MPVLQYYLMTERCDSHIADETITSGRYRLRSTATSATVGSAHVVAFYHLHEPINPRNCRWHCVTKLTLADGGHCNCHQPFCFTTDA